MDVEAPAGDRGATGDEDPARREYWALESGQVVDQLGIVTTTRVQLVAFLGTANILVLGTALSVSKAGLCLVASAIAVLMFVLDAHAGAPNAYDLTRNPPVLLEPEPEPEPPPAEPAPAAEPAPEPEATLEQPVQAEPSFTGQLSG
jgi:hypothetical protein